MIGKSDDEVNFPHKLLLTNRQVSNIRKAFANHTSTDIKFSKAFFQKIFNTIIKVWITFIKICN